MRDAIISEMSDIGGLKKKKTWDHLRLSLEIDFIYMINSTRLIKI